MYDLVNPGFSFQHLITRRVQISTTFWKILYGDDDFISCDNLKTNKASARRNLGQRILRE